MHDMTSQIQKLLGDKKPTRGNMYELLKTLNPERAVGHSRSRSDLIFNMLVEHLLEAQPSAPEPETTALQAAIDEGDASPVVDHSPERIAQRIDQEVAAEEEPKGLDFSAAQTSRLRSDNTNPSPPMQDPDIRPPLLPGLEPPDEEAPNLLELPEGAEPPEGYTRVRNYEGLPFCIAKDGGDPERELTQKECFWLQDIGQILKIIGPKQKIIKNNGKMVRFDPHKNARKALKRALKQLSWVGIQVLNPVADEMVTMNESDLEESHVHGPECGHTHA